MVMPCCSMCYQKYLNEDGTLNKESLDKIYGKNNYQIIDDSGYNKVVKIGLEKVKLCSCICHTIGVNALH